MMNSQRKDQKEYCWNISRQIKTYKAYENSS